MSKTDDPLAYFRQVLDTQADTISDLKSQVTSLQFTVEALHTFINTKFKDELGLGVADWYHTERARKETEKRLNKLVSDLRYMGYNVELKPIKRESGGDDEV